MICEATYDSLDAIPQDLRDEFEQVNGKWQLKPTAVPGVGPLFNKALAANEQKAVNQVKTRNETIKKLEEQLNAANDKLSVLDSPDNKVLSKQDAELFENYVKLGTPKELESKITEYTELKGKVEALETQQTVAAVAKSAGLNADVLADWRNSPEGKDLQFVTKEVEAKDEKTGKPVKQTLAFVKVEKTENGKTTVEEKELLSFAKEALPAWKYSALTTAAADAAPAAATGKQQQQPAAAANGVRLPDLGSSSRQPAEEKKKRAVDVYNEQREARPNPFVKAVQPVAGVAPTVRK